LVELGVDGLDSVLGGGLLPASTCLVTGAPGTGKSVLALQFIVEGARKYNEPGLYITVEETADDIREYARRLGLDICSLEKNGTLTIVEQPVLKGSVMSLEFIEKLVKEKNAKRVVLDSLTLFQYLHQGNPITLRTEILRFITRMRYLGVVLVVTSERSMTSIDYIEYMDTDYLFQSVIMLFKLRSKSSFERCLMVAKTRGLRHSLNVHPFTIGDGGFKVQADGVSFALRGGE
jgi:KaiC/GvpD/RAD55 family RecA-like ATPase